LREKYFLVPFLLLLISSVACSEGSVSSEVHDVAVTQVVAWPTLTLPSFVHAYVTVENQGTSYETFNVTIHADNLTATSATVADLAPGSNKTLERTCGLFPFREMIFPAPWSLDKPMIANVTIWVEASVVSGEVDTADNTCIDGTVHIIWGVLDVDGDGRISILDVVTIAKAFGRRNYGFHPCWDFNQDGIINILDLFYLAESFGRVDFELSSLHSGALQIRAWYATGSETGGWVGSFVVVEVSVSVPTEPVGYDDQCQV
jgi:hypothetical protein